MGGKWKRQFKRTAAWAAAFVFAVSSVCYGAEGAGTAKETVWYPPKEHADVDFSQMEMEPYQLSDMDGAVERLAQATAAEGQEEEVQKRYEELLRRWTGWRRRSAWRISPTAVICRIRRLRRDGAASVPLSRGDGPGGHRDSGGIKLFLRPACLRRRWERTWPGPYGTMKSWTRSWRTL